VPTATCLLVERTLERESLRPVILANGACFELVTVHSLEHARGAIRNIDSLNFAVVDDSVDQAHVITKLLRLAFPTCFVVLISDFASDVDQGTTIVPHDFPAAIAVALRRGARTRKSRSAKAHT